MIENLFPVQIWKSKLFIDYEVKNELLEKINFNYKKYSKYLHPFWDCNIHTTHHEHNNIDYSKLIPYIQQHYHLFCDEINIKRHDYLIEIPWYNYYVKGSNQETHLHLESNQDITTPFYSVVYFLKYNKNHPKLSFHNPSSVYCYYKSQKEFRNQQIFDKKINHSIAENYFQLEVEEDDIVIFPSWISHSVNVQKIDDPRITISLNINLKNK